MSLQKSQIRKTAVILIILILLAALTAMPLFLQADSTGEITPETNLFLPAVYNEANSTPNPGADATATPTFTASPTIHPTITSSATASATPSAIVTATPISEPYIVVVPDCGPGPNIYFYVQGYNWPVDQSVMLSWNGVPQYFLAANMHPGHFSAPWAFAGMTSGVYTVSAISGINGPTASDHYTIPCAAPN